MNERDAIDGNRSAGGLDLPSELDPPPEAGRRIAGVLAARGVFRRSRFRSTPAFLAIAAAAAAAFAVGLAVGAHATRAAPGGHPAAPRFVLFLSPLPGEDAAGEPGRVAEYKRWAQGIGRNGRFITGEKLEDGGRVVSSSGDSAASPEKARSEPAGYFVVEASSVDDAVRIARSCPHVRRGGRITVRAVAPV